MATEEEFQAALTSCRTWTPRKKPARVHKETPTNTSSLTSCRLRPRTKKVLVFESSSEEESPHESEVEEVSEQEAEVTPSRRCENAQNNQIL
jgi:hypothetical protein